MKRKMVVGCGRFMPLNILRNMGKRDDEWTKNGLMERERGRVRTGELPGLKGNDHQLVHPFVRGKRKGGVGKNGSMKKACLRIVIVNLYLP